MSKTLVFSFDGTGNEPSDAGEFTEDESISNVLKLHLLMGGGIEEDLSVTETSNGNQQLTQYYNGIGTRDNGQSIPLLGSLLSWTSNTINVMFAPSFGHAGQILREAMADFKRTDYDSTEDKIVIFGFSRGAALARKFAGQITAQDPDCKVSFLGVFDTVTAMNGIYRRGERTSSTVVFENGTLHPNVERAVHLIALDEYQVSFTPTLINCDNERPEHILEVWFPGVHGDVGGGYWFDGLSDLALEFMISECEKTLKQDIYICSGKNLGGISPLIDDPKNDITTDDIAIHAMADGVIHKHRGMMGEIPDEPRSVYVSDNDRRSTQEDDLPLLHWSVKQRFDKMPDYRPASLRGLKFRLLQKNGRHSVPIEGISGLRGHTLD